MEMLTYFNDVASTLTTTMSLGIHDNIDSFKMFFFGQINAVLNSPTVMVIAGCLLHNVLIFCYLKVSLYISYNSVNNT